MLDCTPAIEPGELPRVPLFPGKRQRWLVSYRVRPDATEGERGQALTELFRAWLPLFPGPIGPPAVVSPEDGPTSSLVQPPVLTRRGPITTTAVEFDYMGPPGTVRWPTFVARRRERIDPLCPVDPVDAILLAVAAPEREAEDPSEGLAPAPGINDDPLGLQLNIDTDKLGRQVKVALFIVGGAAVLYLLHKSR